MWCMWYSPGSILFSKQKLAAASAPLRLCAWSLGFRSDIFLSFSKTVIDGGKYPRLDWKSPGTLGLVYLYSTMEWRFPKELNQIFQEPRLLTMLLHWAPVYMMWNFAHSLTQEHPQSVCVCRILCDVYFLEKEELYISLSACPRHFQAILIAIGNISLFIFTENPGIRHIAWGTLTSQP